MKKFFSLAVLLLSSLAVIAGGAPALTIAPDATTHNGAAAGAAEGFIDAMGNLDVSGMAAGSTLKFNISLADPDFTIGGYQFQINYPSSLSALSENDSDWDNNTGAIYLPGGYITGSFQMLPATNLGARTAGTVDNAAGRVTVGLIWTVPGDRPGNDVGGVIGQLCLTLNPSAVATCTSQSEPVSIVAGTEIFADENAASAFTLGANVSVNFGDPSARVRSDFNGDGNRSAADALGAARAALFGRCNAQVTGGAVDWCNLPEAEFIQTFDFNCNGSVTAADALGCARLALGIANRRSSLKTADFMAVTEDGEISFEYAKSVGAMVTASVRVDGMEISGLSISEEAKKAGWTLLHTIEGGVVSYGLMNPGTTSDLPFPAVNMSYKLTGKEGRIGVLGTLNQKTNYAEFAASPKLYMTGSEK